MFGNNQYKKTKELIIYIASKLSSHDNYGGTVLNKALYFVDNISYLKTASPVSKLTYIKQDFGPTPEPSLFLSLREELINAGEAEMVEVEYFGRIQKKLMPKRNADLTHFTAVEVELVDSIVLMLKDWNGTQASEISHQFPAWQAAKNKESLPYFTFLLSSKEPSPSDVEWALTQLDGVSGC